MRMRTRHARPGAPFRALALVLLLWGSGAALLAPPAAAQAPMAEVCFVVDTGDDPQEPGGAVTRCMRGVAEGAAPADYLQGDVVKITVRNVTVNAWVRVRCLTDCHDAEGKHYFAAYSPGSSTLRFPRDFQDPRGANAVADRAPRYNASWEAVVLIGETPVARGLFNVWLFDRFTSPGLTVMPGERHVIRAAGFDEGAQVSLRVERRLPNGTWDPVYAPAGGLALFTAGGFPNHVFIPPAWVVPKEEAARIAECGAARDGCYRIRVQGAGKDEEVVPFRVAPAELVVDRANSVGNGVDNQHVPGVQEPPEAVQRTREVRVAVDLHYPGGRVFQGPPLAPEDVPVSPLTGERSLRVRVERVNATGALPIRDLTMRHDAAQGRWEARWTVPKDFPLASSEPDAHYRLRLLPDQDAWGNRVPGLILGNWTIEAARLAPALVSAPAVAPRTDEVNVTFAVRYHNGSALGPDDAKAPLRGCFVRASAGEPLNCANHNKTTGVFENGLWVFKARFPRDYAWLEEHRFHLMGGAEASDRWGNAVQEARTDAFRVVEGSPRVNLSTVSRGHDATILERGGGAGNLVTVIATIAYGDGSPFNRHVNQNQSPILPGTLVKRGPGGAVAAQVPFDLREVDASRGRWAGSILLTADDTQTPLGTWTFQFEVRDNLSTPNVNRSVSFDRRIVGIPLLVEPARQPHGLVETEAVQSFRFRVLYEDGNPVPHGNLVDRLAAHVYRYDPAARSPYGNPVSPRLLPRHDADFGWYQVDYKVPNNLFSGTYVFVVTGGDRFGNVLQQAAWSREFSTTSRTLERSVLTQPPREVTRGESATVVFDAREGDVGPAGTGRPLVRVERFDASLGAWVAERADARQDAPDLVDHVGLFPVTTTTPVGLYRFVLEGRDLNLQGIEATSQNFTVRPTELPRTMLQTPPERVVKGASFSFHVERQEGDRYTDAEILFNGRSPVVVNGQPVHLSPPVLIPAATYVNVTWQVPFDAPSGNYSLRIAGRDLYGNRLEVLSPAIEAEAAQLAGRILGNPARVVARGAEATLLFGITYPTGAFYQAPELPVVHVMGASGFVAAASVRPERLAYVATWEPPAEAPAGEYAFEVTGTGVGGNSFPSLRSTSFRVVPGTVERPPVVDVGASLERMHTAIFSVPFDPRDRFVEFTLAYYGPATDATGAVFGTSEPRTETPLAHTLEPETGRYVSRFVTDYQTPPGLYRIFMRGEDGHGNALASKSAVFTLGTTSLTILPDPWPDDGAFGDGKTITISFVARYRSGLVMDDTHGKPSAVMLYTAPGKAARPVTERPEVVFRDGRWHATWTAPEVLPEGLYEFSIGGYDAAGNLISTQKSKAYPVTETLTGSAAKLIPGPGPAILLVALAALAPALRRRRR